MATIDKLAKELGMTVEDLKARIAGPSPAAASVASQHYRARDLPCSATPPCKRTNFRTVDRASKHGVDAGGHEPRN